MIDDMASLKRAMQQMDAEDPTVAQAAKDHAAQILGEANLNFSKMAELIERRRLLLRPAIVARIKRMDQPGMLGDAAFRDTGSALRKEGQSFLQIAEAIEANDRPAPRQMEPVQPVAESEPLFPMASEPGAPGWMTTLILAWGFVSFPFRHPLRFLAVALFALVLFYAYRGVVALSHQLFDNVATVRHGADAAMSSVSSFVNQQILRQSKEASPAPVPSPAAAATTPPSPAPSAAPADTSAPSAAPTAAAAPPTVPAPSATEPTAPASPSAVPAVPSAAPANPPVSTPRRDARTAPAAKPATSCGRNSPSGRCAPFDDNRLADSQPRIFESMMPEEFRRNSRFAGPCKGGVGGCYWGGTRF